MNGTRARFAAAGTIGVLTLAALPALARPATSEVQAWNVSRDPSYASGEPWVAVDPTDSRHVIVGWTATGSPNVCGRAVSWNRGRTWKRDSESSCTDALTAWGPHGVLYFGGILSNDVS